MFPGMQAFSGSGFPAGSGPQVKSIFVSPGSCLRNAKCQSPPPTNPDLLNQNLHLNKIPISTHLRSDGLKKAGAPY